jgi:hypothetical protein
MLLVGTRRHFTLARLTESKEHFFSVLVVIYKNPDDAQTGLSTLEMQSIRVTG